MLQEEVEVQMADGGAHATRVADSSRGACNGGIDRVCALSVGFEKSQRQAVEHVATVVVQRAMELRLVMIENDVWKVVCTFQEARCSERLCDKMQAKAVATHGKQGSVTCRKPNWLTLLSVPHPRLQAPTPKFRGADHHVLGVHSRHEFLPSFNRYFWITKAVR